MIADGISIDPATVALPEMPDYTPLSGDCLYIDCLYIDSNRRPASNPEAGRPVVRRVTPSA